MADLSWRLAENPIRQYGLKVLVRRTSLRLAHDWRSQVQDSWFTSDGIHYTSAGYQQRARRTAEALAIAVPAHGPSPRSCFVRP